MDINKIRKVIENNNQMTVFITSIVLTTIYFFAFDLFYDCENECDEKYISTIFFYWFSSLIIFCIVTRYFSVDIFKRLES